jgi:hypothetical protein
MRVVLFGYQTWGHRTLAALREAGHEVSLVVTHPPSDHAYERIWDDSVEELAIQHGIPVLLRSQPDDEELMSRLKEAEPDVMVATNWRTWIPPQVFGLPRWGTLNVHDSLLPPTPASPLAGPRGPRRGRCRLRAVQPRARDRDLPSTTRVPGPTRGSRPGSLNATASAGTAACLSRMRRCRSRSSRTL